MLALIVNTVTDKLEVRKYSCKSSLEADMCGSVYQEVGYLGKYSVREVCDAFDEYFTLQGNQQSWL